MVRTSKFLALVARLGLFKETTFKCNTESNSPNHMELNLLMKKQNLFTELHMHSTQVYSFFTLARVLAPLSFNFI